MNYKMHGATLIRPARAIALCVLEEIIDEAAAIEEFPPETSSVLLFEPDTALDLVQSVRQALSDL